WPRTPGRSARPGSDSREQLREQRAEALEPGRGRAAADRHARGSFGRGEQLAHGRLDRVKLGHCAELLSQSQALVPLTLVEHREQQVDVLRVLLASRLAIRMRCALVVGGRLDLHAQRRKWMRNADLTLEWLAVGRETQQW